MYIWILLATIMVALSFFNVSPRSDKDHALNEVRAATVTNRFKIEHAAMLKTMECEIIYQKNLGCWDSDSHECKDCDADTGSTRISATGPVDVSCFNPIYYKENTSKCSGKTCEVTVSRACIGEEMTTGEETCNDKMWSFWGNSTVAADATKLDDIVVYNYNYFTKHVPHGYDTERGRKVFPKGIHHMIYCLDEVAERATAENFVRCDMRREDSDSSNTDPTNTNPTETTPDPLNPTNTENSNTSETTTPHTTEKKLSSRTRYLVTFAQIPDKWLSKKDKSPLPILANMLSKRTGSETVYGWTVCDGNETPKCKLYGVNARHGNIRRKEDSNRYDAESNKFSGAGVSINVRTFDTVKTQNQKKDKDGNLMVDSHGNPVYEETRQVRDDYVYEYEKLPDDSVFWASDAFKSSCRVKPCMFAYERIPATDTAYHCYNLMVGFAPDKVRSNQWQDKHKKKTATSQEPQPINVP